MIEIRVRHRNLGHHQEKRRGKPSRGIGLSGFEPQFLRFGWSVSQNTVDERRFALPLQAVLAVRFTGRKTRESWTKLVRRSSPPGMSYRKARCQTPPRLFSSPFCSQRLCCRPPRADDRLHTRAFNRDCLRRCALTLSSEPFSALLRSSRRRRRKPASDPEMGWPTGSLLAGGREISRSSFVAAITDSILSIHLGYGFLSALGKFRVPGSGKREGV